MKSYQQNIETAMSEAKISLNETEYLAYLIGLRVELYKVDELGIKEIQLGYITKLVDVEIQKAQAISLNALDKKKHIPIKNALGVFFHFEKQKALVKFKSIIREDFNDSLDRMKNMEHLEYLDRFFKRLKLHFIPYLTTKTDVIKIDNSGDYITEKELRILLDEYGMYTFLSEENHTRNNNSPVSVKYLNENKFLDIMISFFDFHDVTIDKNHLLIFHDYLTSPYSGYNLYEINNAGDEMDKILTQNNLKQEFKYLLTQEIPSHNPYINKTALRTGISSFFGNKDSYSMSSLRYFSRKENIKQNFIFLTDTKLLARIKNLWGNKG